MSERTSYEPGVPSWADLSTPDVDASKRFYAGLFGWEAQDAGPAEETGGYAMFTLKRPQRRGLSPVQDENQPPMWSTYVATDDADAVAQRAAQAGGNVLFGPMDVMDAGRMAVLAHPAGGMIGVWQADRHTGAELVNEPGTINWNELQTRDVEGAKAFYGAVFGWQPDDQDFGGMTYTLFNVGDTGIAGACARRPAVPDEVPAFWLTYFSVEDCDASVAKVQSSAAARWARRTRWRASGASRSSPTRTARRSASSRESRPRSDRPGVEDLALPGAPRLGVQPPVLLGDLVGVERGPGRHGAGDGDGRDVDAGGLVRPRRQLCERADAGLAQRQARHVGHRLGHAAGEQDRAAARLRHRGAEVRDGGDRAHDVHRPRVELLLRGELAERVRLDQRRVVDEHLRNAERDRRPRRARRAGPARR